jgi:hypothetical protein
MGDVSELAGPCRNLARDPAHNLEFSIAHGGALNQIRKIYKQHTVSCKHDGRACDSIAPSSATDSTRRADLNTRTKLLARVLVATHAERMAM